MQLHLQVSPAQFAPYWNAAQAIAGVQLAIGANSPFLFGKELWRETRIPLFEQATDTRSEELKEQGVRPRVWFGERWITSVFDLFEENARYFPALLPICERRGPDRRCSTPATCRGWPSWPCTTARSTAGTGRSTRSSAARPHLRVENRVLPAGPTVVDTLANAAFYYGLVRALAEAERPMWTQMSFSAAEENFHTGARDGIDADLYWPGLGTVPATELVLRRLLPLAARGSGQLGRRRRRPRPAAGHHRAALPHRDQRRRHGRSRTTRALQDGGMERIPALHAMLDRYVTNMHANQPVHTWELEG